MDKGEKGDREISVFLFVLPALLRGIRKNHMTDLMLVQKAGQSSIYEIRLSLKVLRKFILIFG